MPDWHGWKPAISRKNSSSAERIRLARENILKRSPSNTPFLLTALLAVLLLWTPGAAFAQSSLGAADMPANAHARPYGTGWQCDYGYREANRACAAIQMPANAYVSDFSFRSGWECERGYREISEACIKITVPANAHVVDS